MDKNTEYFLFNKLNAVQISGLANVVIAKQYSINSIYLFTFTKGPRGATKKIVQRKMCKVSPQLHAVKCIWWFRPEQMIALCDDVL